VKTSFWLNEYDFDFGSQTGHAKTSGELHMSIRVVITYAL